MERLARVEVLDDRLGQVRPHHPCESHLREGRELLGHARVRVLGFIFELQRRPDALDSDRGARPRRGGPRVRRLGRLRLARHCFHKNFVEERELRARKNLQAREFSDAGAYLSS